MLRNHLITFVVVCGVAEAFVNPSLSTQNFAKTTKRFNIEFDEAVNESGTRKTPSKNNAELRELTGGSKSENIIGGVRNSANGVKLSSPVIDAPPVNVINDLNLVQPDETKKKELGIWAARGLLLLVAMLWGTNFASVKYLETLCFHPPCNHPPSEAAFARFGIAALASLPLLIGQNKGVILAGLECGLWITMGYITQAMALETISSGKCAFICSLTVVVVPLIGALAFNKPIKPMNIASAAVALTGVGVLEGLIDVHQLTGISAAHAEPILKSAVATASMASTSSMTEAAAMGANTGLLGTIAKTLGVGKGDILAIGQPLGFGFSFMRIEHYVEKYKDVPNRVLTIAAAECVAVGLLSTLWVLHDYHWSFPNFSYMIEPHRLAAIGWTGIMTTLVAIYFEGAALQTASATEAALTFASEPVWASLFGAWLLHERLNLSSYVGGGIILLACVLGALSDVEKEEAIDVESKNLSSQ